MGVSKRISTLLNKILYLLIELLALYEQFKAKRKEAKRNASAKAVQDDPVNWFSGHFGGVPDDMPNNANDADKADSKPD